MTVATGGKETMGMAAGMATAGSRGLLPGLQGLGKSCSWALERVVGQDCLVRPRPAEKKPHQLTIYSLGVRRGLGA